MVFDHDHKASTRTMIGAVVVVAVIIGSGHISSAAQPSIGLGSADSFAVLAGAGITNTGPTTITGDVGTFPTQTETGFGSITLTGTNHAGDAVTQQAKNDLVTGYNDATGRGPTTEILSDLAGQTLTPGIYVSADGTFSNSGDLILDGQGESNPVFVFQMGTTLTTSSGSSVSLINGADACNVYWQVGSSATLGTGSSLHGTILALTSVTMTTGATLVGRALARNGAVTLDTNTITRASCFTPTTTMTTVTSSANPSTSGQDVTFTAKVTSESGSTPTGEVEIFDNGSSLGTATLNSDGTATLTTSELAPGEHTITAVYPGAPGFEASPETSLTQIVNEGSATTTSTPGGESTTTTSTPGGGSSSSPPTRLTIAG